MLGYAVCAFNFLLFERYKHVLICWFYFSLIVDLLSLSFSSFSKVKLRWVGLKRRRGEGGGIIIYQHIKSLLEFNLQSVRKNVSMS